MPLSPGRAFCLGFVAGVAALIVPDAVIWLHGRVYVRRSR